MKPIFISLLLLLSLEVKANFTLDAGKNQIILIGEKVTLNGKISGTGTIDYYQWIENDKTIQNTNGDEIVYNNKIDAENDYKPSTIGEHLLFFQAITPDGTVYQDSLLIVVKNRNGLITTNAGIDKIISLGEFVTLEGKIDGAGAIDYYQWTENDKVLQNTHGDEIVYNNKIDAENDYKPSTVGTHRLKFEVFTSNGDIFEDFLLIKVVKKSNLLKVDAGSDKTIKLGEFVTLEGLITKGNKEANVFSWKENNKLLINMAGDEILYTKYTDRENDYKPRTIGKHTLTFIVETKDKISFKDTLTITVKGEVVDPNLPISRQKLVTMINSEQDVTKVNTSAITDMSYLFKDAPTFNQDISKWDVSNVTNMAYMFSAPYNAFNQNIGNWNVSNVTNMEGMFLGHPDSIHSFYHKYSSKFKQDLNKWDVSNVTNMSKMFKYANRFNGKITDWDVSNVSNMSSMFHGAKSFNRKIENWNVSKVKNMSEMFWIANNFNQNIEKWDVSNVTNMYLLFAGTKKFNQPLNNWDVSNVTNMSHLFDSAKVFNQPLNKWNVSKVTDMSMMFYPDTYHGKGHGIYNQNISNWNVENVVKWDNIFPDFRRVHSAMEELNKPKKFRKK